MKNFSGSLDELLKRARSWQKEAGDAVNKASEQLQPAIKQSLSDASELQTTLSKHVTEWSAQATEQTRQAVTHLQEFSKLGQEALQKSAEQARQTMAEMAEQSRKAVDSISEAARHAQDDKDPSAGPDGKKPG